MPKFARRGGKFVSYMFMVMLGELAVPGGGNGFSSPVVLGGMCRKLYVPNQNFRASCGGATTGVLIIYLNLLTVD